MIYEVIKHIGNSCANNQMRDVSFREITIADPNRWIREEEAEAERIEREELPGGIRFRDFSHGIPTIYELTEAE